MNRFALSLCVAGVALAAVGPALAGNAPVVLTRQPDASFLRPSERAYLLHNARSNNLYRRVAALVGADPNGTVNLTSPPFKLKDEEDWVQIIVAPDNRILDVQEVKQ